MSIPPREDNSDDAARLARAEAELRRRTVAALRRAPIRPCCRDAREVRRLAGIDMERISGADIEALDLLAWRWRRALPPGLAPKLNPADPVVRAGGAGNGGSHDR
jgi:hypothetical protein